MKNNKLVVEIAGAVVDILKKHHKEELLGDVVNYLKSLDKSDSAEIVSPRKLSEKERESLKKLLHKLTGEIPVRVNYSEDENLIDGLKIAYKDKLWDLSLEKQLSVLVKH